MSETDLLQASVSFINLAYTASQWWITVTTALLVATYIAGRHIPLWLLVAVMVLYFLSAAEAIFEVSTYSDFSADYGRRLADFRSLHHVANGAVDPASVLNYVNSKLLQATLVVGTFCAASFTVFHWRKLRATEAA